MHFKEDATPEELKLKLLFSCESLVSNINRVLVHQNLGPAIGSFLAMI
jgi:hypothetical protein